MILDIPDVKKNLADFAKRREINDFKESDFEVYLFPQCWETTSMGLDKPVGMKVITVGYTTVIKHHLSAGVYFGEQFGYFVKTFNNKFLDDLDHHNMLACKEKDRYELEIAGRFPRFENI